MPPHTEGVRGLGGAGRRTNVALLVLLVLALATGIVGYGVATPAAGRVVTVSHIAAGLALLLLVPWKQAIARRGLAPAAAASRPVRSHRPRRTAVDARAWRLGRLLAGSGITMGGVRSIDVVSQTGYRRRFPLADAPSLLLATHVGNRALGGWPLGTGSARPARPPGLLVGEVGGPGGARRRAVVVAAAVPAAVTTPAHPPRLSESLRVHRLEPPEGPVRVVVDTDAGNEIDDQFALAYAVRSPERLTVEAVYAAPFQRGPATTPAEGVARSHAEVLRVVDALGDEALAGRVHRGANGWLPGPRTPVPSPAAEDLVRRARQAGRDGGVLYVVALAAPTNVASALLAAPDIAGHVVVVRLGGTPGCRWSTCLAGRSRRSS